MRPFLMLYRNELKFLTIPGIWLLIWLNTWGLLPKSHGFIRFGAGTMIPFVYGLLFLYALLNHHLRKSKSQEYLLPVSRTAILLATFAATVTWVSTVFPVAFVLDAFYGAVHQFFPAIPQLSGYHISFYSSLTYQITWTILNGLVLCTLIMVGYVVAISVRQLPAITKLASVLAGITIILFGLVYIDSMVTFFTTLYSQSLGVVFWGTHISLLSVTALILAPTLLLYERYGEV